MVKHAAISRRALVCAALVPWLARASDYPSRPVRLIVPGAPGGAPDIRSRQIAQKLTEEWRQQVIVENRPGASGNIALDHVAKSPADGYTIVMAGINVLAISPHLIRQPFDALRDFAPVTKVSAGPLVLAGWPGAPFDSLPGVVAYAKAHPGKLSLAAGAVGETAHMGLELFNRSAGIDLRHIPYAGNNQPFADVASGVVPLVFNFASALLPFLQSGRIRALAVAGERRLAILPELPTFEELGYQGMRVTGWQGILVAAGTPGHIVRKLNGALVKVMHLPDIRDAFIGSGAEIGGDTPDEFGAFIRAEHSRWGRLIREAAIKVE